MSPGILPEQSVPSHPHIPSTAHPYIFESHCHLNHSRFADDLPEVLQRAREAGVREMVVIGADLDSSRSAVALARQHEDLFATVGIHPHDAATWNAAAERELRELAADPKVVAFGEIGLDFYRDLSPRPTQYEAFHAQLDLAAELNLPVVIHTRDSMEEALDVLEPRGHAGEHFLLHCWSGTAEQARRVREFGGILGIGGVVTYKNPGPLVEVVADSPLEALVLETDCPYLTPMPFRGKRNEPGYLPLIAEKIAEAQGVAAATVIAETWKTAANFFRRPSVV